MFRNVLTTSSSVNNTNGSFGSRCRMPLRQSSTSVFPSTSFDSTTHSNGFEFRTPNPTTCRTGNNMTSTSAQTTSSSEPHFRRSVILSVCEGRGQAKGEIGLAAIDLRNPVMILSQFNDNSMYECLRTKCDVFRPFEIIIPNTLMKEQTNDNRLYETLSSHFPLVNITAVERKQFNETKGLDLIRDLCCEEYLSIDIGLQAKYYCLSAFAALINYIELIQHTIYVSKSLKIVYEGSDNTMIIDPTTAKLLELIVNLNDSKSNHSLFGIINRTKTRSGFRLLRSNILQPPTDLMLIQTRLDMIEEIISSRTIFESLQSILEQFSSVDIEHLLSNLVQIPKEDNVKCAERKIENVIHLKHVITLIEPLMHTLSEVENQIFNDYIEVLNDNRFALIMDQINAIILDSCHYEKGTLKMRLEKCHAIKQGFNGLLDVAREAYSESIDDINNLITAYSQKYSLPLKVCYSSTRGYHPQICVTNAKKLSVALPPEFIRVTTSKNAINFTTEEIIARNNRINMSTEEIYLLSNSIMTELLQNILLHIGCLYNLAEVISKIDLVFSFAFQCSVSNYVRPDFSDSLAIKQGRHPILEKILSEQPIANSTLMSEDNNFMIITGPNMSGKSTLLKQVAVLQVMAQIGSYIPAEFASFRICDKLFSRIGSNDDIETNCSSFMIEMKEISYILRNVTPNSLVIIDELGRGTSVEEGVGLCFAICEQFIQSKAFTFFVTHFLELTKLQNYYFNVSNFNFRVNHFDGGDTPSFTYTHILEPGITSELYYGLQLAQLSSLDTRIIEDAKVFAQRLHSIQNRPVISGEMSATNKAKYRLASMLFSLISNQQIADKQILKELKKTYYQEIEANREEEEEQNGVFYFN